MTVGTEALMGKYVDYLLREIAFTPAAHYPLQTIYLGGGTPSLLTAEQLERILGALAARFGIAPDAEISLEANPGTFDLVKLKAFQRAGVNRLSLGVQAFQPHLLKLCGRSHDLRDVFDAIEQIQRAGFANFNLDLIFGLPHQSPEDWEHSLTQALAAQPAHISLYDLILEEQTPFGRRYRSGQAPLPDEEQTVQMYLRTRERLIAAGYEHYEISNFARPGRQCRHNQVYWHNRPYYGIGNGATGYVWGARVERPRRMHDYFLWVEAGQFTIAEAMGSDEELSDTLLLGLRLLAGVELSALQQRFGSAAVENLCAVLQPAFAAGWLLYDEGRLRLSVPDGLLLSNEVFTLLV
ncbi:radical SAM family heme chaperone HemW [Gloeobacter kilaueensis]|uniref:radical SAM family heme chaperone HemW n=1 Tax=Gloeobacter kilaueensis TaxID=1416614 RepID=UPI001FDF6E8F